jgi:hypothetical protein
VSALGYDFQWRQHVTARWPDGKHSFDAVLQKRQGELMLVGLSPVGQPGFIMRLRASGAVDVENHTGKELPFEARYVIADVERVFFPWLDVMEAGEPPPRSGERSTKHGDTQIRERYDAEGKLVTRDFERSTREGLERVRVTYSGVQADRDAPARAVLENPLLGYGLTIETIEQTRLRN